MGARVRAPGAAAQAVHAPVTPIHDARTPCLLSSRESLVALGAQCEQPLEDARVAGACGHANAARTVSICSCQCLCAQMLHERVDARDAASARSGVQHACANAWRRIKSNQHAHALHSPARCSTGQRVRTCAFDSFPVRLGMCVCAHEAGDAQCTDSPRATSQARLAQQLKVARLAEIGNAGHSHATILRTTLVAVAAARTLLSRVPFAFLDAAVPGRLEVCSEMAGEVPHAWAPQQLGRPQRTHQLPESPAFAHRGADPILSLFGVAGTRCNVRPFTLKRAKLRLEALAHSERCQRIAAKSEEAHVTPAYAHPKLGFEGARNEALHSPARAR